MIQILGLRDYVAKSGKTKKAEKFFDKKWRAPSVAALLIDIEKYLAPIPEEEKYNLYFTVANCFEMPGRQLQEQTVIPFDIDNIDVEKIDKYLEPICKTIGVDYNKTAILFSGNGLQFFIETEIKIIDLEYFPKNRLFYKAICERINITLHSLQLPGDADTSVFSPARLMRLPETQNRKPGKETRQAHLLQRVLEVQKFDLQVASRIPIVTDDEQVSKFAMKAYPSPDIKAVVSECHFMRFCKNEPDKVSEQQWYAMLSIAARLHSAGHPQEGRVIAHELSSGYTKYDEYETDIKIDHALQASQPRTCNNISGMYDCTKCPHFGKINTPIAIKGPNYIRTKGTGFHGVVQNPINGEIKIGRPNYEDLRKFFEEKYIYCTMGDSEIVYVYNGSHWSQMPNPFIRHFAQDNFRPYADTTKCSEFKNLVCRTNLRMPSWFEESIKGKINFKNGYLNIDEDKFMKHDAGIGFRYTLPYDYDPDAEAPLFDKFMDEITLDRADLKEILLEFAGYCFSNEDPAWGEKAILLSGEGSNGKSVFIDTLKKLAGTNSCSNMTMKDLKNDQNRAGLEGKLFNVSEEMARDSLFDSSLFKNLVTGGTTTVKKVYQQPYEIKNFAKIIISCNELPDINDFTHGMMRRLIIVPFDALFTPGKNRDPNMREKLWKTELPGIFNVVIEGYRRLKKKGRFIPSDRIKVALKEFAETKDPVIAWVNECVSRGTVDEQVTSVDLYRSYKFFCEQGKEYTLPRSKFYKRLPAIFGEDTRIRTKDFRGYVGWKLYEDKDDF